MNTHLNRRACFALASACLARVQEAITRPVIFEDSCPAETNAPLARDGYRYRGVLRKPPGPEPFPVIIWIHPGLLTFPQSALQNISRRGANPPRFLVAGYVLTLPTYCDEGPERPVGTGEASGQYDVVVRHLMGVVQYGSLFN
jgi:hypothetical protein